MNNKTKQLFATLGNSLTGIMKIPVAKWTTLGASMRDFGSFACDYYIPLFYLTTYPTHKAQFAIMYSLINIFGGIISSLGGGLVSDKFGKGRPMMRSWVCIGGSLVAMPFFWGSVLITNNFWLSIACSAARIVIGESFRSPSVTML